MVTVKDHQYIKKVENGGVTSPIGFKATGVYAGLKKSGKDVGAIYCEVPCTVAAVYTQSHFQAAPLKVTQQSISVEGKLQAVVVNSKNANACTGKQGTEDALLMRKASAEHFNLPPHYVAVASTGVIGQPMPMDKILNGIDQLRVEDTFEGANQFQEAILTTDLVMKNTAYQMEVDDKIITIGGAAKGSGMIHPNMATMLGFITTDANIETTILQNALKEITDETFNRITVDGDTSTNDMVIVMASGLSENDTLHPEHPNWPQFYNALKLTCEDLAKSIARDGEGATKLIEVQVRGAVTDIEAGIVAKKIVGSSLVKTAVYGEDANWGRIIGAIGYSEATVNPELVDIALGPIQMLKDGTPIAFSEEEATEYLRQENITILVDLHVGDGQGKAWGCDLSYDYVKINASYRT